LGVSLKLAEKINKAQLYTCIFLPKKKNRFTSDRETLSIDRQFLWRDALLVSPVLDIGAVTVTAYFPSGNWFDYSTVSEYLKNLSCFMFYIFASSLMDTKINFLMTKIIFTGGKNYF
jgi:Glycosyl hydrolases family 31